MMSNRYFSEMDQTRNYTEWLIWDSKTMHIVDRFKTEFYANRRVTSLNNGTETIEE